MSQEFADQETKKHQGDIIIEMWKKQRKSYFDAKTEQEKLKIKGEIYTNIQTRWEEKFGKPIPRSTVRRCVNQHLKEM